MDIIQLITMLIIILINGLAAIVSARFSKKPLTLCILFWGMLSSFVIPIIGFEFTGFYCRFTAGEAKYHHVITLSRDHIS